VDDRSLLKHRVHDHFQGWDSPLQQGRSYLIKSARIHQAAGTLQTYHAHQILQGVQKVAQFNTLEEFHAEELHPTHSRGTNG